MIRLTKQNFLEGVGCFGIILFEWFQVVSVMGRFNQFPTQTDCVRSSGAVRWGSINPISCQKPVGGGNCPRSLRRCPVGRLRGGSTSLGKWGVEEITGVFSQVPRGFDAGFLLVLPFLGSAVKWSPSASSEERAESDHSRAIHRQGAMPWAGASPSGSTNRFFRLKGRKCGRQSGHP
ncbi:MAG: hypothetical protein M2R46_04837 [Verrucomicrobia subdivision 3 bacterium]|nr:hypothetical protein [Limisphaerales bacterium]